MTRTLVLLKLWAPFLHKNTLGMSTELMFGPLLFWTQSKCLCVGYCQHCRLFTLAFGYITVCLCPRLFPWLQPVCIQDCLVFCVYSGWASLRSLCSSGAQVKFCPSCWFRDTDWTVGPKVPLNKLTLFNLF